MSAKTLVESILRRLAPAVTERLLMERRRRHVRRFEEQMGLSQIAQAFIAAHEPDLRVLAGPFVGMSYVSRAEGSAYVPKLVGSYEEELHSLIAAMPQKGYATVVDVGCAEGYYAVGLARLLPTAQVRAFDTETSAQLLCREMARINGVSDRVSVGGRCDPALLDGLLAGRSLVVCDCEGYEYDLLRPDLAPGLSSADVLVEIHDALNPKIPQAISTRFAATHDIHWVSSTDRDPARYAALHFLSQEKQAIAVCEFRAAGQQWAYLTARN